MRRVTCSHCGKSFNEAQKEWDEAYASGACPSCGRFLDPGREGEVARRAVTPTVVSRARKTRRRLVVSGILTLALAGLVAWSGGSDRKVAALATIAVPQLIYGLAHSSKKQAREELAKKTNLDPFSVE